VWVLGKQRRVGDDQCGVNNLIRGREGKVQDRKEDFGDGNGHDGTRVLETVGEVKEGRAMKKVEKMMMEITINQLSLVFD